MGHIVNSRERNISHGKLRVAFLAAATLGLTTCSLFKAGLGAKIARCIINKHDERGEMPHK